MLMNHFNNVATSMEKPVEEVKPKRKVVIKRKEKPVEKPVERMKRQVIRANYAFDSTWELPVGLKLLTEQEMEKLENKEVPFSWWIRWNELHYYDADMKVVTLQPTCDYQDNDEAVKWPLDTEMWEDDVMDDEDCTRKTCAECNEEVSCGNYNEVKQFICEDCAANI
jgi:hypothetical protein